MSIYYDKFYLNTYANTPYFQGHIPEGYPLYLVLQKSRAFRRLPDGLKELAARAKQWASQRPEYADWMQQSELYYDEEGNELDPRTGNKLTDAEIDAQWEGVWGQKDLDDFVVQDLPTRGPFADPETWGDALPAVDEPPVRPTAAQLWADIATGGREATARAYGLSVEDLPKGAKQKVASTGPPDPDDDDPLIQIDIADGSRYDPSSVKRS